MSQKAAEKTDFLKNRIDLQRGQKIDLNEWIFSKIQIDQVRSVLELCCGTGKQTSYIVKNASPENLTCLDISEDAIEAVKSLESWKDSYTAVSTDMDDYAKSLHEKFDLIFCSYGLYYSVDVQGLLSNIHESLNDGGRLVVVGPHGNNNKPLFDLLEGCGVKFPELVTYSSRDFMYNEVIKFGEYHCRRIQVEMMVNQVGWESKEQIMTYWKSSTFYDSMVENKVDVALTKHFQKNQEFLNEKHVMLIELTK